MSESHETEPLGTIFRRLIANTGPISLMHYMGEANARYYGSKDPLGSAGDFVTAPEISQMFGELIGLCLAQTWLDQGSPRRFTLAELGPGRGTLMADILRATKPAPRFIASSTGSISWQGPSKPSGRSAVVTTSRASRRRAVGYCAIWVSGRE